jgi:hypothetical protein
MSKNIRGAAKYIQKEIDIQQNIVTTETLRESLAKENRERALKRINELKEQLVKLNGDAIHSDGNS